MRVAKIDGAEGTVEAGGVSRRANFTLMKGVRVGDYVLLHAGFAIEKIDPVEARKTLKALRDL
jgi:hydrogenase expression/formation protein HypC